MFDFVVFDTGGLGKVVCNQIWSGDAGFVVLSQGGLICYETRREGGSKKHIRKADVKWEGSDM